jgi:signal transduction histidine kinase
LFFLLSIALCALIGSLQAARLRADAAMRSKERVLEIVAHDLRNPLSAIKMTSAGLERAAPELRPRLKRIDHAVGRMDNLIRDLVDTTRIEHGEFVLSMALEPVASIIDETIEQFAPLAQDQGVALGVEAPPADVSVACDRGRIVQVLSNLVANALKFTDKGGRVTLTWAAEREEVRFDVADTGAGIRPEHLGHVFEQYWRADRAGTGLGLFIAKSVVGAHGGRIWVESEPGRGSNFHFVLPRPANARAVGDSN